MPEVLSLESGSYSWIKGGAQSVIYSRYNSPVAESLIPQFMMIIFRQREFPL